MRPQGRGARLFALAGLLGLVLAAAQSQDVSKTRKVAPKFVESNNTDKISTLSTNKVAQNEEDDEDFYLGYSGYLISGSSTNAHQNKYNLTDENLLSKNSVKLNRPLKASDHRRFKRGVTHLYNMIVCATGCNPLAYKGYGCYCGFLGSGYPMDGIDRCCKMHDWCYDATDCPMFVEYFVPYYWKCYRGYKPICAIEHGEWGSSGSCAQRLCECDRSFSECLRRYRCPRHKAVCTSSPWRLIQNVFMII